VGAAGREVKRRLPGGHRQVVAQRIELSGGLGGVGGLQTLLEIVGAQPAGDGVIVELGDQSLAVLV